MSKARKPETPPGISFRSEHKKRWLRPALFLCCSNNRRSVSLRCVVVVQIWLCIESELTLCSDINAGLDRIGPVETPGWLRGDRSSPVPRRPKMCGFPEACMGRSGFNGRNSCLSLDMRSAVGWRFKVTSPRTGKASGGLLRNRWLGTKKGGQSWPPYELNRMWDTNQ